MIAESRSMKTATIQEVHDHTEKVLTTKTPVFVTRKGKKIAVIQPLPEPSRKPLAVRQRLYRKAIAEIRQEHEAQGITPDDVDREIDALLFKRRRRR